MSHNSEFLQHNPGARREAAFALFCCHHDISPQEALHLWNAVPDEWAVWEASAIALQDSFDKLPEPERARLNEKERVRATRAARKYHGTTRPG